MTAADWIADVLDDASFVAWDTAPEAPADVDYAASLERAAARAGTDESILTGAALLAGAPVAVIVSEFAFLGGSWGASARDRIERAFARARLLRVPVLAGLSSGGTRMQEGTAAFLALRVIARAATDFVAAGLPFLVHLRHPMTGGALASIGSLGHDVGAEPGALIGFLGPKVMRGLGVDMPEGVQLAEELERHGLVDALVDAAGFRRRAIDVLGPLLGGAAAPTTAPGAGPVVATGRPSPRLVLDDVFAQLDDVVAR